MDIIKTPPYNDLKEIYNKYFSLGFLNVDINSKFALISLVGFLVDKLKQKKPDVTPYQVIKKIIGDDIPEDFIKGLSVIIEDFSYGCKTFPTFGIQPKEIPNTIKKILKDYIPF